jgi:hypothetical protein
LKQISIRKRFQRPEVPAVALSLVLGIAAIVLGWRGSDYPAQLFRIHLFHLSGFTAWNNQWYSGHATPGYGILYPALGAAFGPLAVGLLSCVSASWSFAILVCRRWGNRATLGAALFGVGSVVNLAVGRLPFALGLALGLLALVHASAKQVAVGLLFAVLCPLGSPVAGSFLAIAALAWAIGSATSTTGVGSFVSSLSRPALAVGFLALMPILMNALIFPEGGWFPMEPAGALCAIAACLVLGRITGDRTLRIGAALYAVAIVVAFVVPNPAGGNMIRLGMFVAAPLLTCVLLSSHRRHLAVGALVLMVALLIFWQWQPAADAILLSGSDPSTHREYFGPLLTFLHSQNATRIEIPFTQQHWETNFVADDIALVRGWERQLDHKYNNILYSPKLSDATYRAWLVDNGVQHVALPDVDLDFSSRREAELLRSGVGGLREVWRGQNWRVWAVDNTNQLLEGPAVLVGNNANSFDLTATKPGTITVRVRWSRNWNIQGPGCIRPTQDGWTQIVANAKGRFRLQQGLGSIISLGSPEDTHCKAPNG